MQVTWKDQALRWNKYRYGGTTFIKLPVTDVWIPKLKIKEEYSGRNYVGDSSTDNAKIYWNGDVYWVPEGIYSVVCAVNIQFYPYDEQTCTLTYFVANENNLTVSLDHTGNVSLAEFVENPAWKLLQLTHQREQKWGAYFINIHFRLQRRAHFALFTMITPLLMLAFLNIGVFVVPSDCGEKGTYAMTIFLAYGIFITIVSDTLPHNSLQTSYLVVFIISLLSVSAFSVFYAVLQAKLLATLGSREFTIRLPFCSQAATNRVEPIMEVGDDTLPAQNAESTITWEHVLNKIDVIICVIFFVAVTTASVIFLCVMMGHVAEELDLQ